MQKEVGIFVVRQRSASSSMEKHSIDLSTKTTSETHQHEQVKKKE